MDEKAKPEEPGKPDKPPGKPDKPPPEVTEPSPSSVQTYFLIAGQI